MDEFAKKRSSREGEDLVLRLVERTILVHSVLRVSIAFSLAVSLLSTRSQILRYRNSTGFGRFLFTVKMQIFDACLLRIFLSYSRIQQQANAIAHLIAASDQDRHSDSETTKWKIYYLHFPLSLLRFLVDEHRAHRRITKPRNTTMIHFATGSNRISNLFDSRSLRR